MMQKVTRLRPTPPVPTLDHPYLQLDWLAEQYARKYTNKNTRKSFLRVIASLKRYYKDTNGYDERLASDPRLFLTDNIDPFILYDAHHYWMTQGLSSHTLAVMVRVLRRILDYAAAKGYTPIKVFSITMREGKRETLQRESYEAAEIAVIRRLISAEVVYATRVAAGVNVQGIGTDPRVGRGRADGSSGWKNWANIVWYFENQLSCQPFVGREATKRHKSFSNAAEQYYGGLASVWRRLGVSPLIDSELMAPLAMKLALETGLNPDSVLSLSRDCFQESHGLTGQAYLSYHKERSSGNKELHISLLDSKKEIRDQEDLQLFGQAVGHYPTHYRANQNLNGSHCSPCSIRRQRVSLFISTSDQPRNSVGQRYPAQKIKC